MTLSIIIVNWNSVKYLRKCLAAVYAQAGNQEFEVVVIDAASYDGCDKMLCEEFPAVRFIQADKNLGFARANNMAFKASRGEYVLFLNPDTEVVGSAISTMLDQLRSLPKVGSVGCKLLNTDGTIQMSCIQSVPTVANQLLDSEFLRARWPKSSLWGMAALHTGETGVSQVEAISGACVMMSRELFERVGMFSEDYFMYAEDIDLSYKVSNAGMKNYYVPNAEVVHHGGGSSGAATSNFSTVMMRESIWKFLRKHRGPLHAVAYRGAMLVSSFVRLVFLLVCFPVQQLRRRRQAWAGSFQKWRAILSWSVFGEQWVKKHS